MEGSFRICQLHQEIATMQQDLFVELYFGVLRHNGKHGLLTANCFHSWINWKTSGEKECLSVWFVFILISNYKHRFWVGIQSVSIIYEVKQAEKLVIKIKNNKISQKATILGPTPSSLCEWTPLVAHSKSNQGQGILLKGKVYTIVFIVGKKETHWTKEQCDLHACWPKTRVKFQRLIDWATILATVSTPGVALSDPRDHVILDP